MYTLALGCGLEVVQLHNISGKSFLPMLATSTTCSYNACIYVTVYVAMYWYACIYLSMSYEYSTMVSSSFSEK